MNPNTEYEKFTQEIYQPLLSTAPGNVKTVAVWPNAEQTERYRE